VQNCKDDKNKMYYLKCLSITMTLAVRAVAHRCNPAAIQKVLKYKKFILIILIFLNAKTVPQNFTDIGEKTLHLHSEIINNIKTLKSNYRNCLRRNGRHTGFCVNCRINAMGNQRSICATIGIQLKHLFPAWVSKNIAISAELIIKKTLYCL
jgi:hypothetical protein